MKILAPAKLNLGLRILGKRADGYHEIQTVFVEVKGLADELEFELREDGKIEVKCEMLNVALRQAQGDTLIQQEENLVYLAAKRLQKLASGKVGVSIQLIKNIPIGAGLGGGSSDAAATLKALNKLWQLKLSLDELETIGAELGSDVPFFIRGGVQLGRGRGEVLEKIDLPKGFPRQVVLIVPQMRVSTKWAYARIKNSELRIKKPNTQMTLQNDFEPIVFAKYPELKEIKKQLKKAGAKCTSLSGSGSVVFGLFDGEIGDLPDSLSGQINVSLHSG